MSNISTIALSGLKAASSRAAVAANNIANASTTGVLPASDGTVPAGAPQAYDPLQIVQTANAGGGTQTSVTTVKPATVASYDPTSGFANQDGLVATPNVDLAQQMIGLMVARYSFAANAQVLKAADRMSKTLLDTTA